LIVFEGVDFGYGTEDEGQATLDREVALGPPESRTGPASSIKTRNEKPDAGTRSSSNGKPDAETSSSPNGKVAAVLHADPNDGLVLRDLSFRIEPGQTVAIVGQTGSGKTTLTRLVNRVYDASAGKVFVDGIDVRNWALEPLRRQISVIEQDPFLFSRSIAENIAFGRPEASRDEVEQAARDAQAHDFIMKLDEGYETVIGERGVTLSGGQKQRLAIARALLSDPRILILDDSTSAIDSATEDRIQRAMQRAAQGRTTLLITHRLSQIRWADQVLVLRGGKLEAFGPHDELMETSAPYRRLFVRIGS
jgi:ATP-binding cassette subfamily B protein